MVKKITLALLSLLLVPLAMMAQSVTVSPTTGKLVAAATGGNEVGFQNGWSSVWKHEQLSMSFTVADDPGLTGGGDVQVPAGNISVNNSRLVIMGGVETDLYCVLSLPKGYRFKGYRMVLLNNLNGKTVNNMKIGYNGNSSNTFVRSDKVMYETDSEYDTDAPKAVGAYTDGDKENTMLGTTSSNSDTREYVIERESDDANPMGNLLYFRMTHTNTAFFGVTIKSFTVYFTAEGTFDADVVPQVVSNSATSLVMAPFKTSKTDVGNLTRHQTTSGTYYYAYDYLNTQDMEAYTYLYQKDAVDEDGVPSDVAETKKITTVKVDGQMLYALGNDTYYVETPVSVHGQTGWEAPVGYRITGAKFNYLYGSQTSSSTVYKTVCYITCRYSNRTYYLNDQLQFTRTQVAWELDDNNQVYNPRLKKYLSCYGSEDQRYLSYSTNAESRYNLKRDTGGNIYYISKSNTYYYLQYYNYLYAGTWGGQPYYEWQYTLTEPRVVKSGTEYYDADYRAGSSTQTGAAITYPAFNPGRYTLNVYGATGEGDPVFSKTVSSKDDAGVYELNGLNNDAVKFSITGLETGKQALVAVTLTLQSLDPYINKMDIVCRDANKVIELRQSFTANDFSVSGGEFNFYIPSDYAGKNMDFTFEDLYCEDGDNTYYDGKGTGNSRYSFVSSPYFSAFDGVVNNKVTPKATVTWNNDATADGGLYDTRYVGTSSNPQPGAAIDGTHKVYATVAGNIRYKFNNAENLSNTGGQTGTQVLEEYPFTVAKYLASTDPDGSGAKGAFNAIQLNTSSPSTNSGTYYVFTADETRYNIAPSTAWQHRLYAFYRMKINMSAKTYTAVPTWTKVYGKSCYVNSEGKDVGNNMWGLKLETKDGNTVVKGYLTVDEIQKVIDNRTKDDVAGPKLTEQILYVDGSNLKTILNSTTTVNNQTTVKDLSTLKASMGTNGLIYLPENLTSTLDNVAYKISETAFRAGKDIVITDKQPFYAPYEIQVGSGNKAKYNRQVTWARYGATTKQSLILPFTLSLTNGQYSNGGTTFKVTKLTANDLTDDADKTYVQATFAPISDSKAAANTPYLVDISSPSDGTFSIEQDAATVEATTDMDEGTGMFFDTAVEAKYNGVTHTFKPMGSFAGRIFTDSEFRGNNTFFYYASNDLFRSSNELRATFHELFAYPYRSFYGYNVPANASKLAAFLVVFGDETDGISDVSNRIDFAVQSGKGYVEITSGKDANVRITSLNGMLIAIEQMSAGETRTINLPSGVYIVNGMKVIVK